MASSTRGAALRQIGQLFDAGTATGLGDNQLVERFLDRRDELAFATLVDRHGPMVLGVCRAVLGDAAEAEDAFQATFLVLMRRAGTIRGRDTLGGWLHRVAYRVAIRAGAEASRRRTLERRAGELAAHKCGIAGFPDELRVILHEELDRLPENLRMPIILCDLEGLERADAARQLGWTEGELRGRLSRARAKLRDRLTRRGLGLSLAVLIEALANESSAAVARMWVDALAKAAVALPVGKIAATGAISVTAAKLAQATLATLFAAKAKAVVSVSALLFAFGLAGMHTIPAGLAQAGDGDAMKKEMPGPKPAAAPLAKISPFKAEDRTKPVTFSGRVLDPDGKPVVGARLLLGLPIGGPGESQTPRPLGTSDADGRFEVTIARETIGQVVGKRPTEPVIAAVAPGFGPDWAAIAPNTARAEITLRLRRDDVPIEGRVINLEGRPVPDLSVTAFSITEYPPELIKKLRENAGKMNPGYWGEMRNAFILWKDGPIPSVRTGPDGRFRLTGLGRDRVAFLLVEGPAIERSFAHVLTTDDPAYQPVLLPGDGSGERRLEKPRFDLSVSPGRIIQGAVIDSNTRKPIAGAKIHSWYLGSTTTDAQGKFKIGGQPKGRENFLTVEVDDQPYIKVVKSVPNPSGVGPIPVVTTLTRGRWVEGKVRNRADGSPVKAVVKYYPSRDNPHVQGCTDASFLNNNVSDEPEFPTDAEGRFRAVTLPGAGFLTVRVSEPGYLSGPAVAPELSGKVLSVGNFQYEMPQYQALVPIDVPADGPITVPDITLTPGRPQQLRMIGPDGRPVAGTKVAASQGQPFEGEPVAGSDYNFIHKHPGEPETLVILQASRSLGATLELKGDEPDPMRVMLLPAGRITGRLIDEEGRPRPVVGLSLSHQLKSHGSSSSADRSDPISTGPDGRFQFQNLVSGVEYNVSVLKKNEPNFSFRAEGYLHKNWWTVKPGETVDWGDVQVQTYGR